MEQADPDPELTLPSDAKIARWFRTGRALSRVAARDSNSSTEHPHVAVHVQVSFMCRLLLCARNVPACPARNLTKLALPLAQVHSSRGHADVTEQERADARENCAFRVFLCAANL